MALYYIIVTQPNTSCTRIAYYKCVNDCKSCAAISMQNKAVWQVYDKISNSCFICLCLIKYSSQVSVMIQLDSTLMLYKQGSYTVGLIVISLNFIMYAFTYPKPKTNHKIVVQPRYL